MFNTIAELAPLGHLRHFQLDVQGFARANRPTPELDGDGFPALPRPEGTDFRRSFWIVRQNSWN
jgi:hypothetical protein